MLFSGITMPIQSGPLKGKKWCITTSIRYIKGKYVERDTKVLMDNVNKGDTVYDIGAHVGYFSVLCSQIAGRGGKVFSFEPVPLNLRFLNRHIKMNKCDNVVVLNTCISNTIGEKLFDNTKGSATGHLSVNGRLKVNVNTLDNLLKTGKINPPDFIKVNTEGEEQKVLLGSQYIIEKYKPKFLITFHSDELKRNCIIILTQYKYNIHITAKDALYAV